MKVLDPQSALLTTAEVQQFLTDNPPRKEDKKIGSYPVVNLHNYHIIRSDLNNYTTINHPHLSSYPRVGIFMRNLLTRLQPYTLTKAEVFSLINLGIGVSRPRSEEKEDAGSDAGSDAASEAVEETSESELAKSLFRLVIEESEQRFEGEEGEQRIDEILAILREAGEAPDSKSTVVTNGNHAA